MVDTQQLDELADRAATTTLTQDDAELMRKIFQSYTQFFDVVADKNTSLKRLRKMMFGSSSEKTKNVVADAKSDENDEAAAGDTGGEPGESNPDGDSKTRSQTDFESI